MRTEQIRFAEKLTPELFSEVALQAAKSVGGEGGKRGINKPSQLRKFYDELCMWEARVNQQPDKFDEFLPFIRMMNAKVVYAQGRKVVDVDFVQLLSHCLAQVNDPSSLRICKTFMEAFMGFYKVYGPND